MAGGFTIEEKKIPEMKKKVSEYIEKNLIMMFLILFWTLI